MEREIVSKPDSVGFWWMFDKNCYGWEVVQVIQDFPNHFLIYKTGSSDYIRIKPSITKWIKIDFPDKD